MPGLSDRVQTFTDSAIRRMTRISDEYGAINLSQGFPDFDPPKEIMDALAKAAYAEELIFPMALVMRFCASAIVPTDEAAFFSISALRISAAFFS